MRANEKSWRRTWLAPRALHDVSAVRTSTDLLGSQVPTPVCVAPTAYHCLAHPDGELATAAGAARAGALFVLSTRSTRRIEDVAQVIAAEGGSWWFQVYIMRDRDLTASLARRAVAAGAAALVLTGDTPVVGRKRRGRPVSARDWTVNLGELATSAGSARSAEACRWWSRGCCAVTMPWPAGRTEQPR
jgi:4-hydroxymandelate oxidase